MLQEDQDRGCIMSRIGKTRSRISYRTSRIGCMRCRIGKKRSMISFRTGRTGCRLKEEQVRLGGQDHLQDEHVAGLAVEDA